MRNLLSSSTKTGCSEARSAIQKLQNCLLYLSFLLYCMLTLRNIRYHVSYKSKRCQFHWCYLPPWNGPIRDKRKLCWKPTDFSEEIVAFIRQKWTLNRQQILLEMLSLERTSFDIFHRPASISGIFQFLLSRLEKCWEKSYVKPLQLPYSSFQFYNLRIMLSVDTIWNLSSNIFCTDWGLSRFSSGPLFRCRYSIFFFNIFSHPFQWTANQSQYHLTLYKLSYNNFNPLKNDFHLNKTKFWFVPHRNHIAAQFHSKHDIFSAV